MEEDRDMNYPPDFRCPISMELMKDPITICTGVTYDRKNIEKWFFTYKKKTCPATMQCIDNFAITPNHTLKRLILAWLDKHSSQSRPTLLTSLNHHDEMVLLLNTIDSSPFKVSSLKKLRSIVELGGDIKADFVRSGGVEVIVNILVQIVLVDSSDQFVTFRASEEALGVLHQLPLLCEEEKAFQLLSKPESMKSLAIMLQSGSAEARIYAISIFRNMAKDGYDWNSFLQDQGTDFLKSMLELVSDEICSKASSCALELLVEILGSSKKSRLRAIEAGAACVLVELLPDSNRSKCEKMLLLIKLLCECAEGRLAFVEHGMAIAAVSKKLLHVSSTATKVGVKILWLICSFLPTERVLEELLIYGSVKKLLSLLHMDGRSSTKNKAIQILKSHSNSWTQNPCFPPEMKDYLGLVNRPN